MLLKRIKSCYKCWVDTSDLAAKKYLIALKDEVDEIGINKLVNLPTRLNYLERENDNLDVGKLKLFR